MVDHEGRAGPEPSPNLAGGAPTFFGVEKMQGQQKGRRVERVFRHIVDIALLQAHALGKRSRRGSASMSIATACPPSRIRDNNEGI